MSILQSKQMAVDEQFHGFQSVQNPSYDVKQMTSEKKTQDKLQKTAQFLDAYQQLAEGVVSDVSERMTLDMVSPYLTKGMLAFGGEQSLISIKFNYKLAQLIDQKQIEVYASEQKDAVYEVVMEVLNENRTQDQMIQVI